MNEWELWDMVAKAQSYVGQCRMWTPSYPNARPHKCEAYSTGVMVAVTKEVRATNTMVWTKYRDRGREETVWFPPAQWETMPLAAEVGGTS